MLTLLLSISLTGAGLDGDLGADYAGPHADEELSSSSFEDESEDSEDGHFEEEKQFLLHRHVNVRFLLPF